MTFGEWLETQRVENGASKKAFSDSIGVAYSQYINYLKKDMMPRGATLQRIADALKTTPEAITEAMRETVEAPLKPMPAPEAAPKTVREAPVSTSAVTPDIKSENVLHRLEMLEAEVTYLKRTLEILLKST